MNFKVWSLVFFVAFWGCKKDNKTTDSAQNSIAAPKALIVEGIVAKMTKTNENINTTGSVIANEEMELRSEISGKIKSINFKEGTFVNKGQLLVKLEDDDLQAQWNKLKVEIELAEKKETRQKKLLTSSAITEDEYESTMMNLKILKTNEDILKAAIQKTKIIAPFSGIVGLRSVSLGAFISPMDVVATIQNIQPLKLEFSVPEKYNNLIPSGKVIQFAIAGVSETLTAKVYAKEPKIDPNTRTSKIRATFSNPSNKIFPGSYANINIPIGKQIEVIMIPTQAYIPQQEGASVLIKKNGMVTPIPVTAGDRTERYIEILEGLNAGDTVLTTGILQLKAGMPVEVNISDNILIN